jgi:AcrR family transcriptional regulator
MKDSPMHDTSTTAIRSDRLSALRTQMLAEAEITSVQNQSLIQSRREQICEAALSLFLEKGFAATTIRDICARSGVNQASIYDYIANKNDILRRLLNQLWFREDVSTLPIILLDENLSLEDAFEKYFRESWSMKRDGTLLHAREFAVMKDLADQLAPRLGMHSDDQRLDIVANLMVFLSAFGPMRDWLIRDIPDEVILRTISAGAAAMVRSLADQTQT